MPLPPRIGRVGKPLVAPQERRNGADLRRGRGRVAERGEGRGRLARRARCAQRPGEARIALGPAPAAGEPRPHFRVEGRRVADGSTLGERLVQPRDVATGKCHALHGELQQPRPQHLRGRLARHAGARGSHDDVEHRGIRLSGQRERIEGLIRHARLGQNLLRQIEVRQRPVKHDGRGVREAARGLGGPLTDGTRHVAQFFFPITTDEANPIARVIRVEPAASFGLARWDARVWPFVPVGRTQEHRARIGRRPSVLLDARELGLEPFAKAENRAGHP